MKSAVTVLSKHYAASQLQMPKTHMISVAKLGAGADARGILRSAGAEGAEASRLQRAGTEG
eukprot:2462722-Heterocapsa_arctica.AAC.1